MLPLRHAGLWRTADVVLLLIVLAFALTPSAWFLDDTLGSIDWIKHADKLLHASTFLLLALWYAGQYRARSYWRIAFGLLAFGLFIELCQRALSYRTADWLDVAANGLGIVVGLLIAMAGAGGWCLRLERWHADRQITGSRLD